MIWEADAGYLGTGGWDKKLPSITHLLQQSPTSNPSQEVPVRIKHQTYEPMGFILIQTTMHTNPGETKTYRYYAIWGLNERKKEMVL